MHPDARYWNRMAKRYAAMPVADTAAWQEKLARARAVLAPDARVLDLGCGTGSTALALAPHVGHILAVDVSKKMIAHAVGKAALARVGNVAFRTCALDQVDPGDGPFDAVLAMNLLHVLKDPQPALSVIAARLRPGGVAILSTQCLGDNAPLMRYVAPIFTAAGLFPPLGFFRQPDLEGWIAAAGLTIQDTWRPKGPGKAVFHIARKPG